MTETPPVLKTLAVIAKAAAEETRTEERRGQEGERAQCFSAVLFHNSHTQTPVPSTTKGWRS